MTKAAQTFIRELETISVTIAVWAQEQIGNGWSVEDCKVALRGAAAKCGRT